MSGFLHAHCRRTARPLAAIAAFTLAQFLIATCALAATVDFNIAPQPTAGALHDFGRQAGMQLLYSEATVAGRHSPGVVGVYEPAAALRRLLEGTGLRANQDPAGVLVIETAALQPVTLGDAPQQPVLGDAATAVAAPAAAGTTSAPAGGATLEEIVVTAQKRSENLQKTPIAITAISGETLVRRAVTDATGLTTLVPNVQVVQDSSGTTVEIRGIYNSFSGSQVDQSITFNVDGIYYPRTTSQAGTFFDLSRIEVLRGPQGTLLGRSAAAGAVNVVPNRPTAGNAAELAVEMGNYGLLSTYGMANFAASDNVDVRAAFQTLRHNGYLTDGFNDADDVAARLQAAVRLSDSVNLRLYGSYFHESGRGDADVALPFGSNPWQNSLHYLPQLSSQNDTIWDVHAQLDWRLPFGTLTYVPALVQTVCDCSYLNFGILLQTQQRSRQYSQELRLTSNDQDTATQGSLKWIAGLYWLNEHQTETQIGQTGTDPAYTLPNTLPPLTPLEHLNYDPIVSRSYAAFGQTTYSLLDHLRLTTGLRYTHDYKSQYGTAVVLIAPPPYNGPFIDSGSQTFNNVSYRAGLEADLSEHSLLYTTVSTGYKPGGFFDGNPPGNTYHPEHLTSYEIGSKNRFLDQRLQVNADAFYYNYRDFQITELGPTNNGELSGTIILNAGRARIYGLESENSLLLGEHDRIDLTAAWTQATYLQFVVDPMFAVDLSNGQGVFQNDFSHTDMPMVPRFSANLGYQHVFALPGGATLTGQVESHYSTGYWGFFAHIVNTHQSSYTRSEAQLVYTAAAGQWSLEAYVKNIENKGQLTQASTGPAIAAETATITPPRLWGLRLGVKF